MLRIQVTRPIGDDCLISSYIYYSTILQRSHRDYEELYVVRYMVAEIVNGENTSFQPHQLLPSPAVVGVYALSFGHQVLPLGR
jgi:hypothetical protein